MTMTSTMRSTRCARSLPAPRRDCGRDARVVVERRLTSGDYPRFRPRRNAMPASAINDYKDLKLQLDNLVPPGQGFFRNLLFDKLYASIPKDPEIKVQIYNA